MLNYVQFLNEFVTINLWAEYAVFIKRDPLAIVGIKNPADELVFLALNADSTLISKIKGLTICFVI